MCAPSPRGDPWWTGEGTGEGKAVWDPVRELCPLLAGGPGGVPSCLVEIVAGAYWKWRSRISGTPINRFRGVLR